MPISRPPQSSRQPEPTSVSFSRLWITSRASFLDAVSVLEAAQKQGIVDSDLDYLMSECVLKIDSANTALALQHLDRAIELNPHSTAARTSRGKLLLESNQVKEAMADLELALKDDPSSRSAHLQSRSRLQKPG